MRAFHDLGQVLERDRALDDLLLELEAQDDVEVVGRLVGLDADQRGLDVLIARENASSVDRAELLGEAPASGSGSQSVQNGRLRPTRFSHSRLCDSCSPSDARRRAASGSSDRRCRARRGRGPPRAVVDQSAISRSWSGSASSGGRRGSRTRCRTGARSGRAATRRRRSRGSRSRASANARWSSIGKSPSGTRRRRRAPPRRAGQRRPEHVEHRFHLGRLHPRLVVVEQRGRRASRPLEALDVAVLQLDVAAQGGRKAAKSDDLRASIQAWWPRAASRVSSALRARAGTRRAFSQSRRVTRIRLASSESNGKRRPRAGRAASSSRPISARRRARARSGRGAEHLGAGRRRAAASSRAGPSRARLLPGRGRRPRRGACLSS